MELSNIIPDKSRLKHKTIGFSFFYFIWLFSFLSFIGWLWEVGLFFVIDRRFVNRGFLLGPWLPIYGAGGLFLYFLLYRFKKHPLRVFLLAAGICSALEYFCSWFLEKQWDLRWWDYSENFCNLNGRICLAGALTFGTAALLLLYLLLPWFEKFYEKIPPRIRKAGGMLLLLLFVADGAYAAAAPNMGRGISS